MNKIAQAFHRGKAFIPFVMGGDPDLETTERLLYALAGAGADAIEIGIPFSDPIAEGSVVQKANERALTAGCTAEKLLTLVSRVRADIKVPLLFMSYYNPIFAYGVPRFTERCAAAGLDGLIVPDLPFEERDELLDPCATHGLSLISLIAPTSQERIADIARQSGGFLYCVSSPAAGEGCALDDSARRMVEQAKRVTDIPCAVECGIETPEQARAIAGFADGFIIGSAIVRLAAEQGQCCEDSVFRLAQQIKQAIAEG